MMPATRWKLAIPFISKDVPSRSSEFAHPGTTYHLPAPTSTSRFPPWRSSATLQAASSLIVSLALLCVCAADVVIALTFLGYRYEGLRYEDFADVVTAIRQQLAEDVGPMQASQQSQEDRPTMSKHDHDAHSCTSTNNTLNPPPLSVAWKPCTCLIRSGIKHGHEM